MYQLVFEDGVVTLREQDGSGYLVRCCGGGNIETRVVCASGDISDPVRRTPEEFLHHHPDAAEVPGIGAALFRLSRASEGEDAPAAEEAAPSGETRPPAEEPGRSSNGHFKPVLRTIRH